MQMLPEAHPSVPCQKEGILIVNLGTPDSTKWMDIRRYLKEFLSDKRVIEVNPVLWSVILNLVILTFRPAKTAKAYKKIWMKKEDISPLRYYTARQAKLVAERIQTKDIIVSYAMRYGNPSINMKIKEMQKQGCEKLVVLPLYPQYAAATTATVCDEVYRTLMKLRWQPSLKIIPHYESNPHYIKALVQTINHKLKSIEWKPDMIVASYHGIPKKYFEKGDPYHCYCHKTTRLMEEQAKLNIPVITTFQSRFGPDKWLEPYTDKMLEELPKKGKKKILVICPGFSSDCVETLEEIAMEGKETFIEAGGEKFEMVSCLNDQKVHIDLIEKLIVRNL